MPIFDIANKDRLQDWLDSQSELQRKMPSPHPSDLFQDYEILPVVTAADEAEAEGARKEAIEFIHWNVTALTDEAHELLGEIGWKPWAKSQHINLEAARGEFIDMFHFMGNLALVLGLDDAEEIMRRYHAKHEKNAKRQEEGYDGVSTKCPNCHRALDDDAVRCHIVQPGSSDHWDLKPNERAVACDIAHGSIFKLVVAS